MGGLETPLHLSDTFVVGKNVTFSAQQLAVAETPGGTVQSAVPVWRRRTGVPHLMHSIAHYILETNPEARVLYVTSEVFTNELNDSIRNGNSLGHEQFSGTSTATSDVLLIDDAILL